MSAAAAPGPADGPGGDQASSFGSAAQTYDRVRPGYPAGVVRWALGETPRRVVDLGAGTGKLTRVLLAAGHDVVAVEPDPQMRAQLQAVSPEVRALAGTGEDLPLPDGSVDAVTVAQTWHWLDHDRASSELARVLRPGGRAVLLWNLRHDDDPLARAVSAAVTAHAPELAERATADTRHPRRYVTVPDARLVSDGSTVLDSSVRYDVADLLALVGTWSYVALSPERDLIMGAVGAAARALADADGTVLLAQSVHAFRFVRT